MQVQVVSVWRHQTLFLLIPFHGVARPLGIDCVNVVLKTNGACANSMSQIRSGPRFMHIQGGQSTLYHSVCFIQTG